MTPGFTYFESVEDLRNAIEAIAALPFRGKAGHQGIGIGTDFLNLEHPLPQLENVSRLTDWLAASFTPGVAEKLTGTGISPLLLRVGRLE